MFLKAWRPKENMSLVRTREDSGVGGWSSGQGVAGDRLKRCRPVGSLGADPLLRESTVSPKTCCTAFAYLSRSLGNCASQHQPRICRRV